MEGSFGSLKTRCTFIFSEALQVNLCFPVEPVVLNYKMSDIVIEPEKAELNLDGNHDLKGNEPQREEQIREYLTAAVPVNDACPPANR